MDRLELALRRYQQIVPQPVDHDRVPLRDLNIWLMEDVCPVLEDYTRRPAFREHASWPVRALHSGAHTSERRLIERIDSELVNCARALRKLVNKQLIEKRIKENVPQMTVVRGETIEIMESGTRTVNVERGPSVELEIESSQLHAIAERDWADLVNIDDYFEPQQQWTEDNNGRKIQHGDAIVFLNPELLPIGNFIVRRLLARIKLRIDILTSLRKKCLSALAQIRPAYRKECAEFNNAWSELSLLNSELDCILRTGRETQLRDACIATTQVYGAFHPAPDLTWLGLNFAKVDKGLQALRLRSTGWNNDHLFERVARALGILRHLYQDVDSERSAFEEAVAGGGLVINTVRSEAFWDTQPLKKQPTGTAMQLLISLARKAVHRSAVEIRDIWGDNAVSDSVMSTTWDRLKKNLPASLRRLVSPGDEARTYRLDLDADRIHIFPSSSPESERNSSLST